MAAGEVIAGRGDLRVDGKIYNCKVIVPDLGGETLEAVMGYGGVAGFKATPVPPTIQATIIVTPDVSISRCNAIRNKLVEVQMADGRAYTFEGASTTQPLQHSSEEGTAEWNLQAVSGTEVGA